MDVKRAIVWFRNDLRITDNHALWTAHKDNYQILPVFIIENRWFEHNEIGLKRISLFRYRFMLEALQGLNEDLQQRGSALLVLRGDAIENIAALQERYKVQAVFASKESGSEEKAIEDELERKLFNKGVSLNLFAQHTLFHEDNIPWPIRNLPDTFTSFRKESEKSVEVAALIPAPESIKHIPFDKTDNTVEIEPALDEIQAAKINGAMAFQGHRHALKARIYDYFRADKLGIYKESRNGMLGEDYSTKLSPWLALGVVSPRELYFSIRDFENNVLKNQSTYWVIFELLWRDYFKFLAKKHGNAIFTPAGYNGAEIQWLQEKERFSLWANGTTGIPIIDANMRELNTTGFMSNRGRQLVASCLTNDFGIDWTWGAQYFEAKLIDYDVASNWGNWAYVAGVGSDPRKDRYFNLMSQAKKYDASGDYVRFWIPELKEIPGFKVHHPQQLSADELEKYGVSIGKDYPESALDYSKWLY